MNSTIIMSRGYVTLIGIEFETQSCCKRIFIFLNNFPSILLTDYHQFIYVYAILTIPKAYFIFKLPTVLLEKNYVSGNIKSVRV